MASCFLFIHMNLRIQTKNPFDEILSLNFDLRRLKMNTYGIIHDSILQKTIKRTHNKNTFDEKNLRG